MSTGYALDSAWHAERDRLNSLTSLYDPETLRLSRALGLAAGWRCLDAGAGTGSVVERLADAVGPTGSVVGLDADVRLLRAVERDNVEIRQADVVTDPLPTGEFDLVHARLLLEHLPAREDVLARLAAAVRPGGWLLVEDFEWATVLVEPASETHERVVAALQSVFAASGYDAHYGRRLPRALRAAGLADVGARGASAHVQADGSRGVPQWDLLVAQLTPPMLAHGLVTEADLEAFRALMRDGETDCFAPLMVSAWGRRA